ncbi:MAG: acyl-CoA thioesterase [Polyangia bacterium]
MQQPMLAPRAQAESVTEMTEYVLPQHANALGTLFGGQLMAWVDLCGAICASRHSRLTAVTAHVDDLQFDRPVRISEVVRLRACVTATFRTSLEIEVAAEGEDVRTGERWPCALARLTFVAIDEQRRPTPVPPLHLDTEELVRSQRAGEERRAERLRRR